MNDLFLFAPVKVPLQALELSLRAGVGPMPALTLHVFPKGFQVRKPQGILFDLDLAEVADLHLPEPDRSRFNTHYMLSYHPADIETVVAVLTSTLQTHGFVVAADAEDFMPRFQPSQIRELVAHVKQHEM